MLERAAAEVVERFEAARAAIDPDAKPLELPDLFGAPIPADENRSLPPRTPVKPLDRRRCRTGAAEAEEAEQLELRTKLEELLTIIPIWADRLPRMPDPNSSRMKQSAPAIRSSLNCEAVCSAGAVAVKICRHVSAAARSCA